MKTLWLCISFLCFFSLKSMAMDKVCESSKSIEFMVNRISTGLLCSTKEEPGLCNDMIEATNEAYTANVGAVVAAGYSGGAKRKSASHFNFLNLILNRAHAGFNDGILNARQSIQRDAEVRQIKNKLTGHNTNAQRKELLSQLNTLEEKLDHGGSNRIKDSIRTYKNKVEEELGKELKELEKLKKDIKAERPNKPKLSDKFIEDRGTLREALGKEKATRFIDDATRITILEVNIDPDYLDHEGKPINPDSIKTNKDFLPEKMDEIEKIINKETPETQKIMREITSEQKTAGKQFVADTKSYHANSAKQFEEIGQKQKTIQGAKEIVKPFNSANLLQMNAEELKASARGLSSYKIDNPVVEKGRLSLARNVGLVIDNTDRFLSKAGEVFLKKLAQKGGRHVALGVGAFVASGGLSTIANAAEGALLVYDAGSYGVTKLRDKYDKDCQPTNQFEVIKDCKPFTGLTPQFMGYLLLEKSQDRYDKMTPNLCKTLISVYDTYKPDSIELVSCNPNNENFKIYDPQLDDEFEVSIKNGKITRLHGGSEHAATNYAIDFDQNSEKASKLYTMRNNIFVNVNLSDPKSYFTYDVLKIFDPKPKKKSTRYSRRKSLGINARKNVLASAYKMTAGMSELALCCNGSQENFDSTMCKRYQKEKFNENPGSSGFSPPVKSSR